MRSVVISSGHGLHVRGASGYLDEVNEARKVVDRVGELLRGVNCPVKTFHDNTSTSQNQNLSTIVNYHNAQQRDLDVSVHFNAYQTTSKPMGVEVLYVTQSALASDLSAAMASAMGLPNRGGKKRTDLYFLNNTAKPAILIETCFVDSSADASAYRAQFEAACKVIAEKIGQVTIGETPPVEPPTEPPVEPPVEPPTEPPPEQKPTLQMGSSGPYVLEVQKALYTTPYDSDFGDLTDRAVKGFQVGVHLPPNGIVGPETWQALDALTGYIPPGSQLSPEEVNAICEMAALSDISGYSWKDRGVAPTGYIKGMAVAYGAAFHLLRDGSLPMVEMAQANSGNADKDVFEWYLPEFTALGMDNSVAGFDCLRHLYAFLIGLGMRESSGKHCEGRDQSASNVTSDTAEAGAFQTSWNARSCSPERMQELFDKYAADPTLGYLDIFSEGVSCSSSSWQCYGSGAGYKFQYMAKHQPEFAVETAAIPCRRLRQHYGPISRKEVELKREADQMLMEVERILANRVA